MIYVNNKILEQNKFPDNTPLIKLENFIYDERVSQVITWKYENMEELFNLYAVVKEIKRLTKTPIRLLMPYAPNSRQDRQQNQETDIFTLKWFCEIINDLEFEAITIIDAHSNVTPALLNNCVNINNSYLVSIVKDKYDFDMVFYPDNGASKKYSEYIKEPYAFGIKKRDWETGKILDLDIIGDVKDKNILIVDDICSYGGTFYHSAKKLKESGAKDVRLLVTHCENSVLQGEMIKSGLISKIYTTDSIYTGKNDLIEVIYEF